jgi:hypothetical protein
MPWTLTLRDVGPHAATTLVLSHDGPTTLYAPSGGGKSAAMLAFEEAIFGCGPDLEPLGLRAVRRDCDRRETTLTTRTGTVLRRTVTAKGSVSRYLTKPGGEEVSYSSEEAFRAALDGLANRDMLAASHPFGWLSGKLGDKDGRDLRALLLRHLPAADLRAEVARIMAPAELRAADPIDGKGAENARKAANAAEREAAGRLSSARDRLTEDTAPGATVPPEAEAAAKATVQAERIWAAYDSDRERYETREAERARAAVALEEWQTRKAAVPAAPFAEAVQAAEDAQTQAAAAWNAAAGKLRAAREAVSTATTERQSAEAGADPDTASAAAGARKAEEALAALPPDEPCEKCGHVQSAAAARRCNLAAAAEAAHAYAEQVREREPDRRSARVSAAQSALEATQAAEAAARAEYEQREWDSNAANNDVETIRDAKTANTAALRALGPAPVVPEPVAGAIAPGMDRPTAESLTAARETLAAAERERGAAVARAEQATRAADAVIREQTAHRAAEQEAARLDALVTAVRKAPSELARRQAEALGDLGPCSLVWGDGTAKSPAVAVLVDGVPVDVSRPTETPFVAGGRLRSADLSFRAALRRVMKAPWLPLWVDQAQDLGGEDWPDVGGPVVFLRTTDAGELRAVVDEPAAQAA